METTDIKECLADFTRLISFAEEEAKQHNDIGDITTTQINYIETIAELKNPTLTELALRLNVKKPSVTVIVDRLIAKGCIYKINSDTDRRTTHLHLTEVGKQIHKRHDYAHEYLVKVIHNKLSIQEEQQFIALLKKVLS